MKVFNLKMFLILLLISGYTFAADKESRKEAEILLNSIGMETLLEQTIPQMLNLQIQQNPSLEPYKQVMLDFLNKHMSYKNLKPDLIDIYADAFTTNELKEINAFYRTPTGIKAIKLMPSLMEKGGQLGAQKVEENIQELQQMIEKKAAQLKNQ